MSVFVYMAIELEDKAERDRLIKLLQRMNLSPVRRAFSKEYGADALYGFTPRAEAIFEIELSQARDLEGLLLDLQDGVLKWRHYQACAERIGRTVVVMGEDEPVNAEYLRSPLELPVVSLLRDVAAAFTPRPVVLVLDFDFSIRFGAFTELRGLDAIIEGTWQACAMQDLEEPLRLVID